MTPPTRRSPAGFTMIELMLVISIIGVLFSLAIPVFQTFVIRTKMSERNMVVGAVAKVVLEETTRRGVFPTGSTLLATGWNPNFAPGSDQQPWDSNLPGWKDVAFTPERRLRYRYKLDGLIAAGTGTLSVTARADMDNNGVISEYVQTFTLNGGGTWDPEAPVELPTPAER